MAEKVLLIGGGGYIGNVVAYQFLQNKYNLTILDNFIYNHKNSISHLYKFKNFELIEGNIIDKNFLNLKIKNYDCVILLAGLVGDPITKKYPELSRKINDCGVKNVIDVTFRNKIKKLIFISTCSNYGLIENDNLADENHPLAPISLYAKHKVEAEEYIMNFKKKNTITSATILRFATAFGISNRMRFDLTVNEFVKVLQQKKELLVYDANTWRPYCHVKDFTRLIKKVIESDSKKTSFQIFNAGGDINNYTKGMLVKELLKFYDKPSIKFLDKGSDPRNYKVDFKKVKETLDFIPKYTLSDGILEIKNFLSSITPKSNKDIFADWGNYFIKK